MGGAEGLRRVSVWSAESLYGKERAGNGAKGATLTDTQRERD